MRKLIGAMFFSFIFSSLFVLGMEVDLELQDLNNNLITTVPVNSEFYVNIKVIAGSGEQFSAADIVVKKSSTLTFDRTYNGNGYLPVDVAQADIAASAFEADNDFKLSYAGSARTGAVTLARIKAFSGATETTAQVYSDDIYIQNGWVSNWDTSASPPTISQSISSFSVTSGCSPSCSGICGASDGCGGICKTGTCADALQHCTAGICTVDCAADNECLLGQECIQNTCDPIIDQIRTVLKDPRLSVPTDDYGLLNMISDIANALRNLLTRITFN